MTITDFNSSLPVRTETAGDVIVKICDSTTTTQQATVDASGDLHVFNGSNGPVTAGTVATYSTLVGGQYNSTLPTLTTAQQAALQVDSSGRLLVVASNFPTTLDTNWGAVGVSTLRVAAEIGNASGMADFGAGATGSATLRVEANQGAKNSSASNAWYVQVTDGTNFLPTMDIASRAGFQKITDGTNTATIKAASTAAVAADTSLVVAISPNSNIVRSKTEDGAGTAITSGAQSGSIQALDVELAANGAIIKVGICPAKPTTPSKSAEPVK